jgi:phospholipid/cholesterol/gamma-HCH transport system substrate-binding protein
MNEQWMRFRVGLFVLGGLILLGVLATLFNHFTGFLKRHDDYTIVFNDAPGVGTGTPVRRSGVRIGEVQSVQLDDDTGQVRVAIQVDRGHVLRHNDQPTLVHGLLGGDVAIDIVPRPPNGQPADRTPVAPGSELTGAVAADVTGVLNRTSELVPTTRETFQQIRQSLQRLEQTAPVMEETARELRDLAKDSRATLPELRRSNDEVMITARNWGKLGERLDVLLQTNQERLVKALDSFTESVTRVGTVFSDENQRNLAATLKNVRAGSDSLQQAAKPIAERSTSVMKNLDESTDKLNRTLNETRELLRAIGEGDGTLRRVLTDPALYNNLNDSAAMLTHILPRLDRILHDMEVFADKIARHPESLGIGGVVNPSSGLKEVPPSGPRWLGR